MSTKNLSRTVIEGGRNGYSRWSRRFSSKQERIAEHRLSSSFLRDDFLDGAPYEPRTPVARQFSDKLAPAHRWLEAQVGRPWNKIRAELAERFDTRTTAGRHIVLCHLLPSVQVGDTLVRYSRYDFKVDEHGILRRVRRERYRWPRREPLPEPEPVISSWLGDRRVGARDTQLYWFVPTPSGAFRQAGRLEEADAARFRSLPAWFRETRNAFAAPAPSWRT